MAGMPVTAILKEQKSKNPEKTFLDNQGEMP
jgi:hypothetical protein